MIPVSMCMINKMLIFKRRSHFQVEYIIHFFGLIKIEKENYSNYTYYLTIFHSQANRLNPSLLKSIACMKTLLPTKNRVIFSKL